MHALRVGIAAAVRPSPSSGTLVLSDIVFSVPFTYVPIKCFSQTLYS